VIDPKSNVIVEELKVFYEFKMNSFIVRQIRYLQNEHTITYSNLYIFVYFTDEVLCEPYKKIKTYNLEIINSNFNICCMTTNSLKY
jgi:hypothetical protein